jgi:hypothetical protein
VAGSGDPATPEDWFVMNVNSLLSINVFVLVLTGCVTTPTLPAPQQTASVVNSISASGFEELPWKEPIDITDRHFFFRDEAGYYLVVTEPATYYFLGSTSNKASETFSENYSKFFSAKELLENEVLLKEALVEWTLESPSSSAPPLADKLYSMKNGESIALVGGYKLVSHELCYTFEWRSEGSSVDAQELAGVTAEQAAIQALAFMNVYQSAKAEARQQAADKFFKVLATTLAVGLASLATEGYTDTGHMVPVTSYSNGPELVTHSSVVGSAEAASSRPSSNNSDSVFQSKYKRINIYGDDGWQGFATNANSVDGRYNIYSKSGYSGFMKPSSSADGRYDIFNSSGWAGQLYQNGSGDGRYYIIGNDGKYQGYLEPR